MADSQYTYAVARIRTKELALFGQPVIDQLLACKSYEACRQLLTEKGWGKGEGETAEQLLAAEREKTWGFIAELVDDMSVFQTFLVENDYHNLKAAIKQVYMGTEVPHIFSSQGTIPSEVLLKAAKAGNFADIPEAMQFCAKEAYEVQMHTGDSQLCDIIIDRAALEAMQEQGKASGNEVLADYAQLRAAAADIKIALRGYKTGKNAEFLERAVAPCDTLDRKKLIQCALEGEESIYQYLASTAYADAIPEIKNSPSAFEKWCDNRIIESIEPQKYNPFTLSPLAAYILARENEIKTIRILLSGKLNDLPEDSIRQRMREMYV